MTAEEIRHLAALGLSAEQLAAVAEIIAARVAAGSSRTRSKGAERQARYRANQQASVTCDVTRDVTRDAQTVTRDVTEVTPPSPPLPPPPLSPTPPIPAPTRTPTPASAPHTHACEAPAPAKGSKRQQIEADITAANAQPLPLDLSTTAFRASWADWCEHRATLYRREPRKRWSPQAARNTLAECARHGAEIAVMAITAAISNGWQGLVWDRLQPPSAPKNGNDRATHRPPVTRNPEPLPAGRPSLNATASRGADSADLGALQRPGPDADGKTYW